MSFKFLLNVIISATIIASASWLSAKSPRLAGFLAAFPVATMILLPLSYYQHGNLQNTVILAKSIFIAVPVGLLFLVPFFFQAKFELGFWPTYLAGCLWLLPAYFLHKFLVKLFV